MNIENHRENEMNLYEGIESIKEEFFRSGGKGGQNVNKVETAVRLRAKVADEKLLGALRELYPGSVTDGGEFLIECQTERSQYQNRESAYKLFEERLQEARIVPKERIETKPSYAAEEKRLDEKKRRGSQKEARKKVIFEE